MNSLIMLHNIINILYICIMIRDKHKYVHETYGVNRKMKMVSDIVLTPSFQGIRRGSDRIVVGFTTTCAISSYHY